jgi:hypothetical protein
MVDFSTDYELLGKICSIIAALTLSCQSKELLISILDKSIQILT